MNAFIEGIKNKLKDPLGIFFAFFHYIGWLLSNFVGKVFFHLSSEGQEKILNINNNKVVFISNHSSGLDSFFIGACVPFSYMWRVRGFRYMTVRKFITRRPYGFLLWLFGAYPISKIKDPEKTLKKTFKLIERGHNIFMFPTGKREEVYDPKNARPGIGHIAKKFDPVIVPAYVENSYNIGILDYLTRRRGIKVRFGEPFKAGEIIDLNSEPAELAKKIAERIPYKNKS